MNGIAFGMGEKFSAHIKDLKTNRYLLYVEENVFNGNKTIQLMIKGYEN